MATSFCGSTSAAIVRAIMSMARELSIDTTAEGIEQESQLQDLQELGCGTGQGYLLGRPLEVSAADALVRELAPQTKVFGDQTYSLGVNY